MVLRIGNQKGVGTIMNFVMVQFGQEDLLVNNVRTVFPVSVSPYICSGLAGRFWGLSDRRHTVSFFRRIVFGTSKKLFYATIIEGLQLTSEVKRSIVIDNWIFQLISALVGDEYLLLSSKFSILYSF